MQIISEWFSASIKSGFFRLGLFVVVVVVHDFFSRKNESVSSENGQRKVALLILRALFRFVSPFQGCDRAEQRRRLFLFDSLLDYWQNLHYPTTCRRGLPNGRFEWLAVFYFLSRFVIVVTTRKHRFHPASVICFSAPVAFFSAPNRCVFTGRHTHTHTHTLTHQRKQVRKANRREPNRNKKASLGVRRGFLRPFYCVRSHWTGFNGNRLKYLDFYSVCVFFDVPFLFTSAEGKLFLLIDSELMIIRLAEHGTNPLANHIT